MAGEEEPLTKKARILRAKADDAWMYYHLQLKMVPEQMAPEQTVVASEDEVRRHLSIIRHRIKHVQKQQIALQDLEEQSVE